VALSVVEADGFHARVALERPREARGRVLSPGKKDQRGAGQGQGCAVAAAGAAKDRAGPSVPTSGSLSP
jgi:hypothetical protein